MLWRYRTVVWALTAGCMTEDRFQQRYAEEHCALLSDCHSLAAHGYTTVRDCESQQPPTSDCENFVRERATDCIQALVERTCEQALERVAPVSCRRVCD